MNRDKVVEYSRIAVFSGLWALSEVLVGNYFHQLHVPFKGMWLTLVPCFLLSVAVFFFKQKLSILKTGIVVALIRTLISWKFNIFVTLSIFMQGLLIYLTYQIFGKNIGSGMIAGILAQGWTFFQSYFFRVAFYGAQLDDIIKRIMEIEFFQRFSQQIFLLFIILCLIHIIPGLIAGILGFKTGKKLADEK